MTDAVQAYAEEHDLDREKVEWLVASQKVRLGAVRGAV